MFEDLSDEERGTLASWFTVEEVSDSRRLTPEGASGYTFYVIESGTAEVVQSDERIALLGPGDFFGEMALMGGGRRVADVIATSPMVVFAMFGTAFREMEAAFPRSRRRCARPWRSAFPLHSRAVSDRSMGTA